MQRISFHKTRIDYMYHHFLPLSVVSVRNNDDHSLCPPVIGGGTIESRQGFDSRSGLVRSKRVMSVLLIFLSVIAASLSRTWSKSTHHSMRNLRSNCNCPSIAVSEPLSLDRFLQESSNGDSVPTNSSDVCTLEYCTQNYEQQICATESDWVSAVPVAMQVILTIILLSLSALFSGLALGFMSLDITGLEIVMAGDDPKQAQYAKNIYPIRQRGNLVLCTLVLGNVAVNSLVSIFLAAFTTGTVGFLTSTILLVIFGEILPQAVVRLVCGVERRACFVFFHQMRSLTVCLIHWYPTDSVRGMLSILVVPHCLLSNSLEFCFFP